MFLVIYFILWWLHLNESMKVTVKDRKGKWKGNCMLEQCGSRTENTGELSEPLYGLFFLTLWVHVNHGSERILCRGFEKWACWKDVLRFTDPDIFFLLEEIAGLLFFLKEDKEKENEDNDNGEGERRGEEEGEEEKEKPPRGCLCLKFWSQCNYGGLLDEKRDWLLSGRMSWETKAKGHNRARLGRALNVSAGSLYFFLLEEEIHLRINWVKKRKRWSPNHSQDLHFAQKRC